MLAQVVSVSIVLSLIIEWSNTIGALLNKDHTGMLRALIVMGYRISSATTISRGIHTWCIQDSVRDSCQLEQPVASKTVDSKLLPVVGKLPLKLYDGKLSAIQQLGRRCSEANRTWGAV